MLDVSADRCCLDAWLPGGASANKARGGTTDTLSAFETWYRDPDQSPEVLVAGTHNNNDGHMHKPISKGRSRLLTLVRWNVTLHRLGEAEKVAL